MRLFYCPKCKKEEIREDKLILYFKVLENEIKYVNEDNNETLFKTYMENYKENSDINFEEVHCIGSEGQLGIF